MSEEESLFDYNIGDTSYMAMNSGYLTHQPVFFDDLNVTQEVRDMCQENSACIYDSMVTGDIGIGISTLSISVANDEIIQTLG